MIFKYEQRCRLNMEASFFFEAIGKSKKFTVLILTSGNDESAEGEQEWMGFVQTIKHFIRGENTNVVNKVHSYINKFQQE